MEIYIRYTQGLLHIQKLSPLGAQMKLNLSLGRSVRILIKVKWDLRVYAGKGTANWDVELFSIV